MAPTVTTDHGEIITALDRFLAADPVSGTILGTIRGSLEVDAWAAVDDNRLAVRSASAYPVVLAGPWGAEHLDALAALLRAVLGLRGLSGSPDVVAAVLERVRPGTPVAMAQRLFRCDTLRPPAGVAGAAAPAGESHRGLVREWYAAFATDARETFGDPQGAADRAMATGTCWLWHDATGAPVSLATQRDTVAGSGRIGPVYTPPPSRGRGYGSAVTAAATQAVLRDGGIPVLFTDLANPTSNKIYQALGYRAVEDRSVVTFD